MYGWALKLVPVNTEAMSNEICPTVFPLIDDFAQHQPRFEDLDRRMLATHRFRVPILMPLNRYTFSVQAFHAA